MRNYRRSMTTLLGLIVSLLVLAALLLMLATGEPR
jgi:hypothetical protein